MIDLRENWRIGLLVLFVTISAIGLFAPIGGAGDAGNGTQVTSDDPTNLQYGYDFSGGTRVRAPLVGMTAENLDLSGTDRSDVRSTVASELDVSPSNVNVRPGDQSGGAVEVLERNVTAGELVSALDAAGIEASESDVRSGVTAETRSQTVESISAKINRAGLSGGQATETTSASGENFVVVEVPNANRSQVLNLIGDRGQVEIVAHYPVETENGTTYENQTVLTHQQLQRAQIGVAATQNGRPGVQATLTDQDAQNYSEQLRELSFTSAQAVQSQACRYYENREDPGYCLYTVLDGEVVYAASLTPGLAQDIESGEFEQSPTFRMTTRNMADAQALQINLNVGTLPAELDVDSGTVSYVQPTLADRFKSQALLAGLLAWLTVSGVIFLRYNSPRVAVPMLTTAASEVFLLLGFAALIGLPLDLSHIAGFIAVIGTGVDDLVIIADEILQEGKVATGRVFSNRFRKAFWVIGAAAVTTIVAMSPLTVLSLGDLTGFAIVTIVGVLLGVLVTRPAYGDILRHLMVEEDHE